MARQKKCVLCNESILDEQGVPYKGRYAHQRCFNSVIKTLQADKISKVNKIATEKKTKTKVKPKAELKNALSEEEYHEKQRYYSYLRETTGEHELSAKTYALTEDYIKRYGFTYLNMYKTLVYLREIVEKELVGDAVGIIPYYYSEAMHYYATVDKVAESNANIDITNMYKHKTILVRPKNRKIKQLDIKSIGKEVKP